MLMMMKMTRMKLKRMKKKHGRDSRYSCGRRNCVVICKLPILHPHTKQQLFLLQRAIAAITYLSPGGRLCKLVLLDLA